MGNTAGVAERWSLGGKNAFRELLFRASSASIFGDWVAKSYYFPSREEEDGEGRKASHTLGCPSLLEGA